MLKKLIENLESIGVKDVRFLPSSVFSYDLGDEYTTQHRETHPISNVKVFPDGTRRTKNEMISAFLFVLF